MRAERRAQQAKKTKKSKKGLFLFLGILVVGFIGFYALKMNFFTTHYFPKSKANGVDISEMTLNKAEKALEEKAHQDTFTVIENGIPWKEIPKKDLGISQNFTKGLAKILTKQNSAMWLTSYLGSHTHEIKDASIDEASLQKYSESLKTEIETLNKDKEKTENATIIKTDIGFSIQPEVQGTTLDVAKAMDGIEHAITTGKNSIDLKDYIERPTVLADNAELKENLKTIEKIVAQPVQYKISGKTIDVPEETLSNWVQFDNKKNNVALNRDKMTVYVTELGNTYNTSAKPTTFKSTKRGEVSVPAGTYSWTINTDAEVTALTSAVLAGKGVTRTPEIQGSAPADLPLIGDTYIEIDMDNQHMYFYKGGSLQLDTDIVSGKPTTPTPHGVFYVWSKERNATLRGLNDDGSKYASPVDYWMPIDWTGVGIHDSNWQPAYGGSLWKTVGSHGCINTPPALASKLFNAVEVGTPVLVF